MATPEVKTPPSIFDPRFCGIGNDHYQFIIPVSPGERQQVPMQDVIHMALPPGGLTAFRHYRPEIIFPSDWRNAQDLVIQDSDENRLTFNPKIVFSDLVHSQSSIILIDPESLLFVVTPIEGNPFIVDGQRFMYLHDNQRIIRAEMLAPIENSSLINTLAALPDLQSTDPDLIRALCNTIEQLRVNGIDQQN